MSNFELLIKKLEALDTEINIIGDFNCDVSASPFNAPTKVAYYQNYFINNFGNIKNTWKGVNDLRGKNSRTNVISSIKVGGLQLHFSKWRKLDLT